MPLSLPSIHCFSSAVQLLCFLLLVLISIPHARSAPSDSSQPSSSGEEKQRIVLSYPFEGCLDTRGSAGGDSEAFPMLLGKNVRESVMRDLSSKVADFLRTADTPRVLQGQSIWTPADSITAAEEEPSTSVPLVSSYLTALQMEVTTVPAGLTDKKLLELAKGIPCVQQAFLDSNKYSDPEPNVLTEDISQDIEDALSSSIDGLPGTLRFLQEMQSSNAAKRLDPGKVIKAFEEGLSPCQLEPEKCQANKESPSNGTETPSPAGLAATVAQSLLQKIPVGVAGTSSEEASSSPASSLDVNGMSSAERGPGFSLHPSDVQFPLQWSLRSAEPMSIQAETVWPWWTGSTNPFTLAIIDSGCDLSHPDLKNKVWSNPGEVCGDGIDNDGNGFVDDCHGYDFANNDADPSPTRSGHGTGAAGIIAAESNNARGITGICWGCKIMCLKFIGNGQGKVSDQVRAIDYAVKMGAKISNNSYGGYGFSKLEYSAIQRAQVAGHLFVCSAGNNNLDTDLKENDHTPSVYELHNIIAVGAVDHFGRKARFSNYGKKSVDVMAPGVQIRTVETANRYATVSGTSFAAPAAAGAAALIWSAFPQLSHIQVKQLLIDGCLSEVQDPMVSELSACGGRLNIHRSLYVAALMANGLYPGHKALKSNGGVRPGVAKRNSQKTGGPSAGGITLNSLTKSLRTGGVAGGVLAGRSTPARAVPNAPETAPGTGLDLVRFFSAMFTGIGG